VRVYAPTTTTKLAERMLAASTAVAQCMPAGFYANPALDILLELHVAEEAARYLSVDDLAPAGSPSVAVTTRWIDALIVQGLIERRDPLLALSAKGHELVVTLTGAVFKAQRALD
jgi:hypothetical protein